MCGRYNLTKKAETLEKELSIKIIEKELFDGMVNIAPGELAPVLLWGNASPQFFQFGLTPFWAKKKMYFFNARAEGDFNKKNDPNYTGNKGILQKPSFRKPIRSQRCLIIANSFIEGPEEEKLSKPYLIFRQDFKAFTFGGIWDEWVDEATGEILHSFAIITTPANAITQKIGHKRAPLIIAAEDRNTWLNPDMPMNAITALMKPFDAKNFNSYPISDRIKNPKNKAIELLKPAEHTKPTYTLFNVQEDIELYGIGESRTKNKRRKEEE